MLLRRMVSGAALAVAVSLGACGPVAKQSEVNGGRERTVLLVENNNWSDMTLYVLRDGLRSRVGSVPAMTRGRFYLPESLIVGVGQVRIQADPIGSSQRWTSQPIQVVPGQEVRFRLENNVNLSSYVVY